MNKKTIRDIEVAGKRVLLRAALNVPIADGRVTDNRRLKAALPTIQYLMDQGAKIVLLSHHSTEGQSLEPVTQALSELLGRPVEFAGDVLAPHVHELIANLQPGNIALFENLRFHPEEEAGDQNFAKSLATLGDVYVDDDFTTAHRDHASITGIAKFLPAVAGLQFETEVNTITQALENPRRPLTAIIGGAKISTKAPILANLLPKVQAIFVGGAMANTFMVAAGQAVGKSLIEPDQVETARGIMTDAVARKVQLILPVDVIVTTDTKAATDVRTVAATSVGPDDIIADVGPQTVALLNPVLAQQGTVIWNGPVGIFETPAFAAGSKLLAEAIINSGSASIIGGGDTSSFLDQAELADKFSFISTGGGASLDLMSGKNLPGIEALNDKAVA